MHFLSCVTVSEEVFIIRYALFRFYSNSKKQSTDSLGIILWKLLVLRTEYASSYS